MVELKGRHRMPIRGLIVASVLALLSVIPIATIVMIFHENKEIVKTVLLLAGTGITLAATWLTLAGKNHH